VARLVLVAVVVNFAWEMAQMVLYASSASRVQDSVGCLRASVGDAGMILAIDLAGALVFRRLDWFRRPRISGYALMLTMGVILAAAFEMAALRSGRWAYTASMPRLPMAGGLGVLPMLQMVILPPIIFKVACVLER
jgi:hypothetical protein